MADKKTDTDIADVAPAPTPSERVESWKEIAAYLSRDVRTVQRWEKSEALPVYRHMHDERGTVYAYKAELDAWWNNRRPRLEVEEPEEIQPAKLLTKRRLWLGVVAAMLVVGLGAGLWLTRAPRLAFQERDWVLITQFENRTGEAVLDGTLEYALERELSNSRFVNVVPRERAADSLRLMKKPADTAIDAAIGREIALRDGGIRAMLTGRVERLDSTYVLSVALVNPASGVTVASLSEQVVGQQQLLPAVSRLAIRVRQTLGEELALLQPDTQKLEKATTPSLRALQLYSRGRALVDPLTATPEWGPAAEFFRQAVAEDANFASAHLWLGWGLFNTGKRNEGLPHFQRAFELADTTTDHEKYFILGCYYWQYLDDTEKAAQAFEIAAKLYPDHYWTILKLTETYRELGRWRKAVPLNVRLAELRPNDWLANCQAAQAVAAGTLSVDQARPYLERTQALISSENLTRRPACAAWAEAFPAYQYWLHADVERALTEAVRVQKTLDSLSPSGRDPLAYSLYELYWTLGKLKASEGAAQLIIDPVVRQDALMWLALDRGDQKRMKELLSTANPTEHGMVVVLARAGLVPEAQEAMRFLEREGHSPKQLYNAPGELALAQGQTQKAIALLEEAARLNPGTADKPISAGLLTLARAYAQKGDLTKAIRLLEEASKQKIWAAMVGSARPAGWMEAQSQLVVFYRKAGRNEDAWRIEAELRKLLVYADADHPIVRQLRESHAVAAAQTVKRP